jgi:hypothetical protein
MARDRRGRGLDLGLDFVREVAAAPLGGRGEERSEEGRGRGGLKWGVDIEVRNAGVGRGGRLGPLGPPGKRGGTARWSWGPLELVYGAGPVNSWWVSDSVIRNGFHPSFILQLGWWNMFLFCIRCHLVSFYLHFIYYIAPNSPLMLDRV